jgi:hypothetical protein
MTYVYLRVIADINQDQYNKLLNYLWRNCKADVTEFKLRSARKDSLKDGWTKL